ncbi:hypothetical protein QR685DRAFT_434046, partial [Neurospora intermedia]
PIVSLTINSRINTTIGIFRFFAIYGFNIELLIFIIEEEVHLKPPLFSIKKRIY